MTLREADTPDTPPPAGTFRTRPQVLVHAGAGGLGSTVIQLAKHLGAQVATPEAPVYVEQGRANGKVVITIAP